jgi:protocatechuate 3,4-dioxygenase alpha subunit
MADNQSPELFGQTPWQTVGPFFHHALPTHEDLTAGAASGARIEIVGAVFDAHGAPVPDALVEIWQANAAGRYNSPADERGGVALDQGFKGFGRAATDAEGGFRFVTLPPGRAPGPGNSLQAPHIAVGVFGRGLLKRLCTRLYFEDGVGNDEDLILALVPQERRATLIARRVGEASYRFDIHLQGEHETVFFDL